VKLLNPVFFFISNGDKYQPASSPKKRIGELALETKNDLRHRRLKPRTSRLAQTIINTRQRPCRTQCRLYYKNYAGITQNYSKEHEIDHKMLSAKIKLIWPVNAADVLNY
jgi:hypothetical protein